MEERAGRSSVTGGERVDGERGAEGHAPPRPPAEEHASVERADEGYGPEQRAADRRLGAEVAQRRADESRPDGGRGAAPSFDREPYPAVYGPPYRVDLKRALRAYVLGHDRGIESERKLELAERWEAEAGDRAERFRGPPAKGEVDLESLSGASGGHPESVEEDVPESLMRHARFGVPVPERLSFHRGPDVWRDRERLGERAGRGARAPELEATPAEREAAAERGDAPPAGAADASADRREG